RCSKWILSRETSPWFKIRQNAMKNRLRDIIARSLLECGSAVPLLIGMLMALVPRSGVAGDESGTHQAVEAQIARDYSSLLDLYKHLHTHPELSFQEEKTS